MNRSSIVLIAMAFLLVLDLVFVCRAPRASRRGWSSNSPWQGLFRTRSPKCALGDTRPLAMLRNLPMQRARATGKTLCLPEFLAETHFAMCRRVLAREIRGQLR